MPGIAAAYVSTTKRIPLAPASHGMAVTTTLLSLEQWANFVEEKDVGIWKAGTKGRAPEGTRLMMPSFFG